MNPPTISDAVITETAATGSSEQGAPEQSQTHNQYPIAAYQQQYTYHQQQQQQQHGIYPNEHQQSDFNYQQIYQNYAPLSSYNSQFAQQQDYTGSQAQHNSWDNRNSVEQYEQYADSETQLEQQQTFSYGYQQEQYGSEQYGSEQYGFDQSQVPGQYASVENNNNNNNTKTEAATAAELPPPTLEAMQSALRWLKAADSREAFEAFETLQQTLETFSRTKDQVAYLERQRDEEEAALRTQQNMLVPAPDKVPTTDHVVKNSLVESISNTQECLQDKQNISGSKPNTIDETTTNESPKKQKLNGTDQVQIKRIFDTATARDCNISEDQSTLIRSSGNQNSISSTAAEFTTKSRTNSISVDDIDNELPDVGYFNGPESFPALISEDDLTDENNTQQTNQYYSEISANDADALNRLVQLTSTHNKFQTNYVDSLRLSGCNPLKQSIYTNTREHGGGKRCRSSDELDVRRENGYHSVIAIDCEMIETTEDDMALARVSVIGYDGECVADYFVLPCHPDFIVDCRTAITGIDVAKLRNEGVSMMEAINRFRSLVSIDTIVVGHAVHHDLLALRTSHSQVIDSAFLYPVVDSSEHYHSLEYLTQIVLKRSMQRKARGGIHDSIEDARNALDLIKHLVCTTQGHTLSPPLPRRPSKSHHGRGRSILGGGVGALLQSVKLKESGRMSKAPKDAETKDRQLGKLSARPSSRSVASSRDTNEKKRSVQKDVLKSGIIGASNKRTRHNLDTYLASKSGSFELSTSVKGAGGASNNAVPIVGNARTVLPRGLNANFPVSRALGGVKKKTQQRKNFAALLSKTKRQSNARRR